jgi:excisionase family DNA binding protein
MTQETQPPLLTREGLALALGVHKTTIYRLTALGRIPYVSVGRRGKRYDLQAVVLALAVKNKTLTK